MGDTFLLVADIIASGALVLLGLVVFIKNSQVPLHRTFFIFTLTTSIWILANYFSNDHSISMGRLMVANEGVFLFAALSVISLLLFTAQLTGRHFGRAAKVSVGLLVVCALTAVTPWLATGLVSEKNIYAVDFGPLTPVYALSLLGAIGGTIYMLIKSLRGAKGINRIRIVVFFRSLLAVILIVLTTNFILPTIVGEFQLTQIGMLALLVLAGALYYTTAKHKLFDIRLIIIRSLGYVTSIVLLSAVYAVLMFGLITVVFQLSIPFRVQIVMSLVVAVASLGFQPLKRTFDRVSNGLFYRDAYDIRMLLDRLNAIFISTVNIGELLGKTSQVIVEMMKLTYCQMLIVDKRGLYKTYGDTRHTLDPSTVKAIRRAATHTQEEVLVTDYLADDISTLKEEFLALDIALVAHITQNARSKKEGVGYIILGPKQSGNGYTSQDVAVMQTLVKELVIGVQNALQFQQIQNFNLTLQQKVDDATRQLRHANQRLKALDETKDDFISMASHQLRTPLTSVKGYLSMVLDGDAGKLSRTQHDMLHQAFISSQHMVYLISDLLNVSRLKTGKFVIESSPVNLADVVTEEIDQLKETAAARQVKLDFKRPPKFPEFMLDDTKIRQVIMNFMDNAVYYTRAGGTVTISLDDTDKTVELRVKDNGIGVPKAEQYRLFTKFYRAGNARKVRPDGTGLGLFMAKKVVAAQGGSIIFDSQEGKGSTFGFSFDRSKVSVPVKPAAK